MGVEIEIRPEFYPPVLDLFYEAEGKALGACISSIRRFSKKHGIRPITDYLDHRKRMPDDNFDLEAWATARDDWHSPSEALAEVESLLASIQTDPKAAERWNKMDPDGLVRLLQDLQDLARCLEEAVSYGVKFRLEIMFTST